MSIVSSLRDRLTRLFRPHNLQPQERANTLRTRLGFESLEARTVASADISADGRFVVWDSVDTDLVAGDTNRAVDVFLRNTKRGTTIRISVSSSGAQANGQSANPAISADGRYIVYSSNASNLVPKDTNGESDIFVYDRIARTTKRVSVATGGAQAVGGSNWIFTADVSADGRYVAFASSASNLVPGDTNRGTDVFVRDTLLKTTTQVSVDSEGNPSDERDDGNAVFLGMSPDGRYVVFTSSATNLIVGRTTDPFELVYVRDTVNGTTTLASADNSGNPANNGSAGNSISLDGRYVTFFSSASNLAPYNGLSHVFVRDLLTGTNTMLVSPSIELGEGDPYISADGRYVAFESNADNLVPGDTNRVGDVFVRDLVTGTTVRANVSSAGVQSAKSGGSSACMGMSGDGRYVLFITRAPNLVPGDTAGTTDVFVRDLVTGKTKLVSRPSNPV